MTPLLRITSALFTTAAIAGCASVPAPQDNIGVGPDGCTIINKHTGQILSVPVECLAQKQLAAEAEAKALQRKAELEAMASLTAAIIRQPISKDNPQAQNMGTVLGILKLEEVAKQSGLDARDLKETLPGGWTKRQIEQAARLVRAVFNGQCSRDLTNKLDTCWDKDDKKPADKNHAAPKH